MISDLVIIGGGASGFMGAITAITNGLRSVVILEGTSKVLEKVRISGGGRCNLTNSCFEISNLVNNYPRGEKQLLGLFNRFSTTEAFDWFQKKGLNLKVEKDGRVFPCSDSSEEVISCLTSAAKNSGVKVLTNSYVKQISKIEGGFNLLVKGNNSFQAKNILICTGGHSSGRRLAKSLGHSIIQPVPSLFSFSTADSSLRDCSGITLDVQIQLNVNNKKYSGKGNGRTLSRGQKCVARRSAACDALPSSRRCARASSAPPPAPARLCQNGARLASRPTRSPSLRSVSATTAISRQQSRGSSQN